ncbi:protein kinase [Leptolyngbya sp. BL0902]|uniref:leucine-rich repeat-containing protein kinase family protein n=1 Tax=Leptolyngbya sp. BL0902 TaxID=1115757 RepID=UPI0018E789FC|nr:leucine-rich repeat-containing protein kinase family protein [Leptolyngbya sp. BL0902]QQE63458.1 protein kinase [Leptolyngbya sp. BL0902]
MHSLEQLRQGQLAGLQRLNLSAQLTTFPAEIFDLADSLEVLDLSRNQLSTLPEDLPRLHRLKVIFLSNNQFETWPEVLAHCPHLRMIGLKSNRLTHLPEQALPPQTRWLILTDNQLETLPAAIGTLPHLQKLMLAGNRLTTLPPELAHCRNLELIRLAANQLTELPPWLLTLPRLSWLAYAGNPFCAHWSASVADSLPIANWADLVKGEVLGQGASGVITKGRWKTDPGDQEVAIKFFKGDITSDGYPADEIRACLAAGTHDHLISPIGQVAHHPKGQQGLVFPLIPASYRVLGGPPSLESCTRDTYPPDRTFSLAVALRIAHSLAAAAHHLHQRGLLHGDLYPHNTLYNDDGMAKLGDFGAASFYPVDDVALGQALERLEVRAFGCVLEDLLDRCPIAEDDSAASATYTALRQLQHHCQGSDQRPRFSEILDRLATHLAETAPTQPPASP